MADLSSTQLSIIAIAVVVVLALIVFGLRRGSLKSANFEGLGVQAGLEGGQEAEPLEGQTMQTDDFKSNRSRFRIVKGARTSFRRTRFKNSLLEILPDQEAAPTRPVDPPIPPDPQPPQDPH
jgi:hypothetical protein